MTIRTAFDSRCWRTSTALALGFALALLSTAPLLAGEGVFTPHHLARLRTVAAAAISPDGTQVAYLLSVPRNPFKEKDGPAWAELHVVDLSGNSRPYVTGQVNVSAVDWTPDGKGISFLVKRGEDKHRSLYLIPSDGGEAQRIFSHGANITAYSWSPDGARVAFLATEAEAKEKRQLKEKGFNQQIYEEEVKPVRVWVAGIGEEDAEPRMLDLPGSASELHWSPAGSQLAVALAPTPLIDDHYMRRKLHVVDADSGQVLARIDNPGKLGPVAWSPDGRHLALISSADINDPLQGRLMVVPATGGALRDLLPGFAGHVAAIAWQNADTVMFVADEGVWTTFGEVRADGSGQHTIVPVGGPVLQGLALSRDGQAGAFRGQAPSHPAEVFFMKHGDARPRRLTTSNPWLADLRLAEQEVVSYKARDGLELEALLIRPLDYQQGQRYPLILTVHGGPESRYSNRWLTAYSLPGQMAAARGFAVFYPNYRASTGRGVAFSKLDHRDPAGKEFDDLVDAVDHLIATGLVDKDRVGVTGGSYGGYATAWCSTFYSDRFAAGVMYAGITDNLSKMGTSDIPNEMFLVHQRVRLWDDWQLFLERSPVFHAGNSRTPLLIAHGTTDKRVHPGQSMELYRHLKLRSQAPVRLVFYPGEPHGNRRAAHRFDYNLRLLRWFEHYLKGPGGAPPSYTLDYGQAHPDAQPEE